jgi:hypothetical protein
VNPHTTAQIIDQSISLAACAGGSYFCHYMLINKKTFDPNILRLLPIGRVLGMIGAAISCFLIIATILGWQ